MKTVSGTVNGIVNGLGSENQIDRKWWKDGTVYQIYPASFKDDNGDGLGDLRGIISKLDYLKALGVDIIWVSPMYDSPQVDMGYDISNYEEVYPPYGTIADMDTLIQEAHSRGMRIILDLVVNHTSDQHAWFKESRSSKDNPKRDWYLWRPAKYDKDGNRQPPNNWRSNFSQPAWTWDEQTQEYYLHLFCPEMPDLNWENDETRKAIHDSALRFWLEKGVDGFRVDTVNLYSKGDMKDAPVVDPNYSHQPAGPMYSNGPRMHEWLREIYNKVLSNYDTMTVGELPNTPKNEDVLKYVSAADPMLSMVFQFGLVDLGIGKHHKFDYTPFTLSQFKKTWTEMQQLTVDSDGWSTAFMENHDQGRSISRFASDDPKFRVLSGKMLAMLLGTLTGTLFLYQGQEIGMINAPKTWGLEDYIDVDAVNYINLIRKNSNNDPTAMAGVLKGLQILGRDNARLPMQWDDSKNAGFSTSKPWQRVHDLYPEINVKRQEGDPDSTLSFWKTMLAMRKEHRDLFVYGRFVPYDLESNKTFVYGKALGNKVQALVALNFTDEEQPFEQPAEVSGGLQLAIDNYGSKSTPGQALRPYEGRVYLVG